MKRIYAEGHLIQMDRLENKLQARKSRSHVLVGSVMTVCKNNIENHGYRNKRVRDSLYHNISIGPETWVCPVCLDTCNCSQCTRKRTKEGQLKN
jgi:hypothetical protein